MKSVAALLVLASILSGCVSSRTTSIGADSGHSLQGKSLALSKRAKQDFSAATPAKAAFGLIGALAMISAGNQLVADNANDITKLDDAPIDPHAVDVAALGTGQVNQHDLVFCEFQNRVFPADLVVIQNNVVRIESPNVQDGVWCNLVDHLVIHDEVRNCNSGFSSTIFHRHDGDILN